MAKSATQKKTSKQAKSAKGRTSGRRGASRAGASRSARGRTSNGSGRQAARDRREENRERPSQRGQNAIAMLRDDHRRVEELFDRFERARGDGQKDKIAEQVCAELELHARLEEEIFYPAVRDAIRETELVEEAEVEHQSAKDLIHQIQKMSSGDEKFDATVKVLGEYVKHHVKEEEREMFPQAREAGVDLAELGERMRERRERLSSGGLLSRILQG